MRPRTQARLPTWRPGTRTAAAALLILFAVRAGRSSLERSVTIDEFAHLPSGIVHATRWDLRPYAGSAPLARTLLALPAVTLRPVVPLDALAVEGRVDPWRLGEDFETANREGYRRLFAAARLANVALGVLLGAAVFAASRRLWGDRGALLSLALLVLEPNVVAHAGLVTTDLGLCLALVVAVAALRAALVRPSPGRLAWGGLALGLAQLTKFTALLLYPAAFLAALLSVRPLRPALRRLLAMGAMSLAVIDLGYHAQGVFRRLDSYAFESRLFRSAARRLPAPVPLPSLYLLGLDEQIADLEASFPTYLNGRIYIGKEAPWYYEVEALAAKTPLGEAALLVLAGFVLAGLARSGQAEERSAARSAIGWWALPAVLLLGSTSESHLNMGLRYVLPLYPIAHVLAGAAARRMPRLALVLVGAAAAESLAWRHDEIAFFNALVGGPEQGLRLLAESNLDWGQDLPALARLVREQGASPLHLAYFGRVDPRLYGIDFALARPPFEPGWYAVSASYLAGCPYRLRDARSGESRWVAPGEFAPFRARSPVARAGDSIYLYRVPDTGLPSSPAPAPAVR